jgi:phenylacetate-CoA ligase
VLDGDHRVPMVFQYNPASHHLETNEKGELIVTLNYSRTLSPRVRYNIGDEGRLYRRSDLLTKLHSAGHPTAVGPDRALPLPYLLLFGRKDQTISIMGANIYPEDVERVLYAIPELAAGMASFTMSVEDRGDGSVFPRVCVEWLTETPPELPVADLAPALGRGLVALNSDFKNAAAEYAGALQFELQVHGFGSGPFAGRSQRIKNRYLEKK